MITLISDIDGTLLGDEKGLSEFREYAANTGIRLIYATGRNSKEFESAMADSGLPEPDAYILNTGADIYIRENSVYPVDKEWHARIGAEWEKEKIFACIPGGGGMRGQGKDEEYKLSYFVDEESAPEIRKAVEIGFERAGLKAEILLSHGVYMDVLPAGCHKGSAALYLIEKMGLDKDSVIVAGDSENDAELFECFAAGIMVSNARRGLAEKIKGNGHYMSRSPYALGVVEGLKYYERIRG